MEKIRYFLEQNHLKITDTKLKNLIIIAIISKIAIFLVMILAYFVFPFNTGLFNANVVLERSVDFFTIFKTWDAQHYLLLAEKGYPHELSMSWVLYPLYPFIIKVTGFLFLGNTLLAGLIFSNFCSILAIVYFYLLVKKLYNDEIAFIASLFMISFPTFFFTSLVYSEGLFLLLVIAFFYYLYENRFYPCLLISLLLPLTRPTGILVIVPLFVYLVMNIEKGKKVHISKNYLLLVGFISGFLIYLCLMNYFTGSFFSGFDAQKLFVANYSLSNLFHPLSWIQRNFINIHYTLNGYTTSILNRIFFGFFLILLYYIYQYLDKTLFTFSLILGLIPALTGDFMGFIRYILVIFPMYIVLALKFQKNPYVIIVPSIAFQILLLTAHSLHYWVA